MRSILSYLDRFHWLGLLIAAPFLVFPSPVRSLALLMIPAIWILYLIQYRIENRRLKNEAGNDQPSTFNLQPSTEPGFPITQLNINILILAVMLLVSLWATYSIQQSLEKITGLVLGLGVFFAVVRESRNQGGWWWSLAVFLLGGLAWAGLGFLSMEYQVRFSFLTPVISRIPRVIQDLPGPDLGLQHNAVGGGILWVLPIYIALGVNFINADKKSMLRLITEGLRLKVEGSKSWNSERDGRILVWGVKIGVWFGAVFMGLVLLLTQSRGSYLAFGLTVVGLLSLVLPRKGRFALSGTALAGVLGLIVWILIAGGWEGWVENLGLAGQSGYSLDTLGARLEIWPRAMYGIEDFPLTGMGMNTFRELVHILYPFFTISPDFDIAHAHNEFLQVGLDLGIPGMIAFISLYLIAFWTLLKTWRASDLIAPAENENSTVRPAGLPLQKVLNQDPFLVKTLVLGLGGGLFGHLVFGMMDAIALGAKPGIFFWMLLGLIMGLDKLVVAESADVSE